MGPTISGLRLQGNESLSMKMRKRKNRKHGRRTLVVSPLKKSICTLGIRRGFRPHLDFEEGLLTGGKTADKNTEIGTVEE